MAKALYKVEPERMWNQFWVTRIKPYGPGGRSIIAYKERHIAERVADFLNQHEGEEAD